MRNYQVEKLTSGKSLYAVDIQGLDNAPVYDIRLSDCAFANAEKPSIVKNIKGVSLKNVRLNGKLVNEF